jgi:outer membrane protein assembly factor BamB
MGTGTRQVTRAADQTARSTLDHTPQTSSRARRRRHLVALAASLTITSLLTGCSESLPSLPKLNDINPFAEKPVPLPGKRVAVLQGENRVGGGGELAAADGPFNIPPPVANESWTQPGGTPNNSPGHLTLAATVKTAWTADIGSGSGKYGKLTAGPIVVGGKIFTLDAAGKVTAFNTAGGGSAWRVSVAPEGEKSPEKGFGGGLAFDNGRLYAATGFGTVVALDPASGKKLWEKSLGVPVRSSPTASADKIVAVTTEGEVYCLNGADGSEAWTFRGQTEKASITFNPSPAIDGDTVVVPFSSGDLVALKLSNGQSAWSESLSRTRTASSLLAMSDAARPVVDGGVVFAVGHAGRMIAAQARTGERLWSLSVPGIQAPWVVGDTVFVVDTGGQLMAITRRDGKIRWTTKLVGSGAYSGPVLAGGKLWLTSSTGSLVSVEATTGKVASTQDLGAAIYIAPIVAGGRIYVVNDKAKLFALN